MISTKKRKWPAITDRVEFEKQLAATKPKRKSSKTISLEELDAKIYEFLCKEILEKKKELHYLKRDWESLILAQSNGHDCHLRELEFLKGKYKNELE